MSEMNGVTEMYRRSRPKMFKHVVGQDEVVNALVEMLRQNRLPHCILLSGPSGCGKTTLARILKDKLQCHDDDWSEVNAADANGIDDVRSMLSRMRLRPLGGSCKIYYLDECHRFSAASFNALLKPLEDTPEWVYFILSTTDPQKVLPTIRTRATEFKLRNLTTTELKQVVEEAMDRLYGDAKIFADAVLYKIAELADGSARKAVVLANQIIDLKTPAEQLKALRDETVQVTADKLGSMLMYKKPWKEIAEVLKATEDDPESIRFRVLGYAVKVLLDGGKMAPRAMELINRFEPHWRDGQKAAMVAACYDVCHK